MTKTAIRFGMNLKTHGKVQEICCMSINLLALDGHTGKKCLKI
jgi:hypothetical protein